MLQSWFGIIRSMDDALCLIEAARTGVIPRITRRLTEKERKALIQPGAVFIFEENESQVRRWADALLWSSSRIKGHFLIYKELDPNGVYSTGLSEGSPFHSKGPNSDDESGPSFSATKSPELQAKAYTLKKKSLSLSTNCGQKLRLISYYREIDVNRLPTIESDPRLTDIYVPDNLYWSSSDMPLASSRTTRRRPDTGNPTNMDAASYIHPQPQYALKPQKLTNTHASLMHRNLDQHAAMHQFRSDVQQAYIHPQAQQNAYPPRTYSTPSNGQHSMYNSQLTPGRYSLPNPGLYPSPSLQEHRNAVPKHVRSASPHGSQHLHVPPAQFLHRALSPLATPIQARSLTPQQPRTLTPQMYPLRTVGSIYSIGDHARHTRNPPGKNQMQSHPRRPRIRPSHASPYTRPTSTKMGNPPPPESAGSSTSDDAKMYYPSWSRPAISESKTPSPMRSPSLTISPDQQLPNSYPPMFKCRPDSTRVARTSSPPLQTILLPVLDSQVYNNMGYRYKHIEDSADKKFLSALDRTLSSNYGRGET